MKFIGPTSNIDLDSSLNLRYGLKCLSVTKTGIHPVTLWYNTEEKRAAKIEEMRAEGSES
jgi:hypothetical protein